MGRAVSFHTLGCKLNHYETEEMAARCAADGLAVDMRGADGAGGTVVVNTCAVTSKAEQKARRVIRGALRTARRVIVTGCYAELDAPFLRTLAVEGGAELIILRDAGKPHIARLAAAPFSGDPVSGAAASGETALDELTLDAAALNESALAKLALGAAASGETAMSTVASDAAARGEAALSEPALDAAALGAVVSDAATLSEPVSGEAASSAATLEDPAVGKPASSEPALGATALGEAALDAVILSEPALDEPVLGAAVSVEPVLDVAASGEVVSDATALGAATLGELASGVVARSRAASGETAVSAAALGDPASGVAASDEPVLGATVSDGLISGATASDAAALGEPASGETAVSVAFLDAATLGEPASGATALGAAARDEAASGATASAGPVLSELALDAAASSETVLDAAFLDAARSRPFIKIQTGCDYACTFCRTRLARGPSVSTPRKAVLAALAAWERAGRAEAVLTGVNICQYAGGDGVSHQAADGLAGLLGFLLDGTERIALRLSSLEPDALSAAFYAAVAHPRVRPHFHLSMQSGDADVLRAMGRGYGPDALANAVRRLREAKDDPFIACDVIAGFPGETAAAFDRTVRLCEALGFAWIHAFPYSRRPGTAACALPGRVPEREAAARVRVLGELAREGRAAYARRQVARGEPLAAVLETPEERGYRAALTENYIKVTIEGAAPAGARPGGAALCRLTGANGDGTARGVFVAAPAAGRSAPRRASVPKPSRSNRPSIP